MSQINRVVERSTGPAAKSSPRYADDERWEAVVETVRRRRDFWIHCGAYLIVNGLLLVVWQILVSTAATQLFWPGVPLVGWGVGLAVHAVATFGRPSVPVTEAEIRAVMQRLRRSRG